jgi:hypothetical protein
VLLVTATGMQTQLGQIAALLQAVTRAHPPSTMDLSDLAPFSISGFRRREAPPKPAFTVRALRARTVNAKGARSEIWLQMGCPPSPSRWSLPNPRLWNVLPTIQGRVFLRRGWGGIWSASA